MAGGGNLDSSRLVHSWSLEALSPSCLEKSCAKHGDACMPWEPARLPARQLKVLRKLPDCINKVTPPGPNQIPLERVASGKAAAHTWQNWGHQAQTQQEGGSVLGPKSYCLTQAKGCTSQEAVPV